jgi:hypothetical protein
MTKFVLFSKFEATWPDKGDQRMKFNDQAHVPGISPHNALTTPPSRLDPINVDQFNLDIQFDLELPFPQFQRSPRFNQIVILNAQICANG